MVLGWVSIPIDCVGGPLQKINLDVIQSYYFAYTVMGTQNVKWHSGYLLFKSYSN